jgi:hypothetical protein
MTVPVPDTLEELLSPAWLTAALEPRFPGIVVTAVEPGPVISRVSTNARFRIECRDGQPEGLSPYLCGKGYFGETGRVSREAGEPEAYFYRDLASATGVRTLRSVYADVDPSTRHGVVITEDVLVHGATFLDARSDYTPDQAAESLEQLAVLHATTWGDAALAEVTWLQPRMARVTTARGITEISNNFEGPIGAGVPANVRNAERLYESYCALAAETPSAVPWSVIHGDAHVGNLFLDGGGRPAFVDWQLVQRGPWYIDVGYHIASALTVEDRRRHEADLVRHYLEQLAARGADPPSADAAWAGIRRGILYGFYLWGITVYVDPAITTALLERLGTAAADHDAYGAVAEPLRP